MPQAGRVVKVEVRVGHLRQVVPDSLEFAFSLITQGTALDGAALDGSPTSRLRDAAGTAAGESVMDGFPLCCTACGGLDLELLAGEELLVEALELEEECVDERKGRSWQPRLKVSRRVSRRSTSFGSPRA